MGELVIPSEENIEALRYQGEFRNGLQDGDGVCKYPNGDLYTGRWKEGMRSGKGTLVLMSLAEEDGSGRGSEASGSSHSKQPRTYVGDWQENVRHGVGKYEDVGWVYEGEWKADKREGKGVLTLKSGRKFDGDWGNDRLNGLIKVCQTGFYITER